MIVIKFKDTFRERLPEWICSFALMFWGIIVLSETPELWSVQYFSVLAGFATQTVWGWCTVLLGMARIGALFINGAWRPTAHIRAIGALLGVLVWSSIIIGYLTLPWNPPALATKSAMLVFDMCAIWFAAGDAKRADVKANKLYLGRKAASVA